MNMLMQLEVEDPNGRTPLHYACYYSSAEVISGLCRLKANVNHVDKKRRTPLHVVVYRKHAGVATSRFSIPSLASLSGQLPIPYESFGCQQTLTTAGECRVRVCDRLA